ncbi:MAG: insulinase family protein [Magnetovibrio sp.]|nr:insulinase family protein [Magnetovibrio sp.]
MKYLLTIFAVLLFPLNVWAVTVERVISPGGIEAWLVQDRANPVVSLRLAFEGGAELDPVGKSGLANLASSTMDEGAGDIDSQTFQQTLADQSITLRFDASLDLFTARIKTLTQNLDQSMDLLRLALTQPRFDDEPVARIKSQIISGLRSDSENPGQRAYDALFATLFPGHGYAQNVDGTVQSVEAIGSDDLKTFVRTRLTRSNLVIGVVGDVTPKRLGLLLDKTFGDLPIKPTGVRAKDITPNVTGRLQVIDLDILQSTIVFAQGGLKRDHEDYYVALVMNHILGGGSFTSRLYQEVREKRGLAYSVGSSLYPMDHSALMLGSAGTENARVGETIEVIRAEWARMAAGDVSQQEVNDAKTYVTGAFPLTFTSTGAIARVLVAMQLNKLGIDYLEKRNAYIGAVSLSDVKRVAAKYLRPDALDIVVVGKPVGIVPSP